MRSQPRWGQTPLALVSCVVGASIESSSVADSVMPTVTAPRLDVARREIKRADFSNVVEVLGGRTFGLIVEAYWLVCEELPKVGETLASPRPAIDLRCSRPEQEVAIPACHATF